MTHDDEPINPNDTEQIDDWIDLMLSSRPNQPDYQHDLPDPQLLRKLQAMSWEQAQTVNDRVARVWRRLEARARLSAHGQRRAVSPARPVSQQERRPLMQHPMLPIHPPRRWPTRFAALAAAVLLVALVGGLVIGLVLVRHPGGQTAHPQPTLSATATAMKTPTPPVTPTPGSTTSIVPVFVNFTMLDAQHGWALDNPEQVTQTPTSTTITISSSGQYKVLVTSDGGSHWQDVTPPVRQGLPLTPDFVTASLAWVFIAESNQLYVTTDGGQSWQQLASPASTQYGAVVSFTFLNAQDGWMLLSSGGKAAALFGTTDGGQNWTLLQSTDAQGDYGAGGLPLEHIQWMSFIDASNGWAAGTNARSDGVVRLYTTHDGGATWQSQSPPLPAQGFSGPTVEARAPEFFTPQDGILDVVSSSATFQPEIAGSPDSGGVGRVIYVTHDGGATWQSGALLPDPQGTVAFADADHGWVASSYSRDVWATSDGGQTWTKLPRNQNSAAPSTLVFVSAQTGWAGRNDTYKGTILLKTDDGGRTWTQINFSVSG